MNCILLGGILLPVICLSTESLRHSEGRPLLDCVSKKEGKCMRALCIHISPVPRPARRFRLQAFPYCKRRKAGRGLGTRLHTYIFLLVDTFVSAYICQ